MSKDESTDVLVVGGSIVGLSMAAFLAFHGVKPVVVERRPPRHGLLRAGHFRRRTLEVFRRLGVEDEIRATAEVQYNQQGGIIGVDSLAGTTTVRYSHGLNQGLENISPSSALFITQDGVEPALLKNAQQNGCDIRYSTEMLSVDQDDSEVTAVVRDASDVERTIQCKYLIACDGYHSKIRDDLDIAMEGHGYLSDCVTVYFRADCRPYVDWRNDVIIYVSNDEVSGYFRLDRDSLGGRLQVNVVGPRDHPESSVISAVNTNERAEELLRAAIGVSDIPVEISAVTPWTMAAEVANQYRQGRVFLAGDAAHVNPPNGGFGANTGIQDAWNLAWKLAYCLDGRAGTELLDTYEPERRPIAMEIVEQSYARYVERVALGRANAEPPPAPLIDDLALEIGQHYSSPAVIPDITNAADAAHVDPRAHGGAPGTRAPHIWLSVRGERVSSLDLFGPRFVLLAGPEAGPWRDAVSPNIGDLTNVMDVYVLKKDDEAVDVEEAFPGRFGVKPDGAVLIRPDGYVAWRIVTTTGVAGATVTEVLRRVLGLPGPGPAGSS